MREILKQADADHLIRIEKFSVNENFSTFPTFGGRLEIPLESYDGREKFLLDINRGNINLKKITHQTRYGQTHVLARLDIEGPNHRNPDGSEIGCPHLHIYKEGYGDKWAIEVPNGLVVPDDIELTLKNFFEFCNIRKPPNIVMGFPNEY
ncbi:MAG: hypothetical protein EOP04_14695 [Proteobacteria bacterium]|nr:MAG: hypothetical protein EOP04_14695 [Pseudomonadota bacterium]